MREKERNERYILHSFHPRQMFRSRPDVKPKPAGIPDVAKPSPSVGGLLPSFLAPVFAHKAPPPPPPAALTVKTMHNPVPDEVRRNIFFGFRGIHELQGTKRVAVAVGVAVGLAGGLTLLGEYLRGMAPTNLSDAMKEGQVQPQFPVPLAFAPAAAATATTVTATTTPTAAVATAGDAVNPVSASSSSSSNSDSSTVPPAMTAAGSKPLTNESSSAIKLRPANRPGWVNAQETPPAQKLKVRW